MPGPDNGLGKKAEQKIKQWLDKPEEGYSFDRIPDQMTGFYAVSRNICDFICFKSPNLYYIESKSTWNSRFDFNNMSDIQYHGLLEKSKIEGCYGVIVVLFASHKRAFLLDIKQVEAIISTGKKSINIDKIDKWDFLYGEIPTIQNNRKMLLDYSGKFEEIWKKAQYDNWNI